MPVTSPPAVAPTAGIEPVEPLAGADPSANDCCVDLPDHSRAQRVLLRWIDRYQRAASGRPSPCRFFPSCSEYGADAIHLHGAARGSWLTVRRLLRCRPFGPSGFDPVPLPDHQET